MLGLLSCIEALFSLPVDPWVFGAGLGLSILGGATVGVVLAVTRPFLTRIGEVGDYLTGIGMVLVYLVFLKITVEPVFGGSFFSGSLRNTGVGIAAVSLLSVSVVIGGIGTFLWRRKAKKDGFYRSEEEEEGDTKGWGEMSNWLLLRQAVSFAVLVPLLHGIGNELFGGESLVELTARQLPALRVAAANNPEHAEPQYVLARSLMRLKKWNEALEVAETAVNLEPANPEYQATLGWCYIGLGKDEQALQPFRKAATLDPDNPRLWRDLGRLAHMLGRNQEAFDAFSVVHDLNPNHLVWSPSDRRIWREMEADYSRGGR